MPPMTAWFEGRASVSSFLDRMIFAEAGASGIPLRLGWCNGQPAFATYQPDGRGGFTAGGLQILELEKQGDELLIAAVVSFRDGELAVRCNFPRTISA